MKKNFKTFLLVFSLLFLDCEAFAHESAVVNGLVSVAGDSSGGKINISGEAAKKIFDTLPKGCQKAFLIMRFGTGISCLKNSQQDDYQCMIGYTQDGVFTLFGRPSNCSDQQ